MKPHTTALLAAITFGMSAASVTAADPAIWKTAQTFTAALTFSYTAPGTVAKDPETGKPLPLNEDGGPASDNDYTIETYNKNDELTKSVHTTEHITKVIVKKVGNIDLLKALAADGTLPVIGTAASATHIGWSIVYITDGEEGEGTLYARHTTKELVPLDDISFGPDEGATAETSSLKIVESTTFNLATGLDTTTTTYSGTMSIKCAGMGALDFNGPVLLTGLYTQTGSKNTVKTETIDGEKIVTVVWTPGAQKLDKIIGDASLILPSSDTVETVVEGSLSLAAATVINYNTYGPADGS